MQPRRPGRLHTLTSAALASIRRAAWGATALWRALVFLLRTPELRWRSFLPILLLVPTVALGIVGVFVASEALLATLAPEHSRWLDVGVGIAAAVLGALLGLVVTFGISGAVSERVARRQLTALGVATLPDDPLFTSVGRSLRVAVTGLFVAVTAWFVLLLANLLFPPLVVVTAPLGIVVTGVVLAWEVFDAPMEVRHMGVRERARWFREHAAEVLGLGLALSVLLATPLMQLLWAPAAVAAAARLLAGERVTI